MHRGRCLVFQFRQCLLTTFLLVSLFESPVGSIEMITPIATPSPLSSPKLQLPPNYNKDERPSGRFGDAVHVEFDIHVQAINPIKASDMDFRMELSLSLGWSDPRLVFPEQAFEDAERLVLPTEFIDLIWHPDPFFANAKSTDVGQLTQKLINIYVYKNQTVRYTVNLFATIACAMQFQYFPYDFQLCPTVIESFSYDERLVKYVWSPNEPFTINPKLRLLQFVVTYPLRYEECSIHRIKEARNFSQLVAYFRFDRLLGNHLIQTFAPCSLIVSLTWFSFWLELDAVSARVSLLVTAMLTLVTQFSALKGDFPPVAYAKAVDLWMAMCLCFVFAALGEFVVVKVIYSLTEDAKAVRALTNLDRNAQGTSVSTSTISPPTAAFLSPREKLIIRPNNVPSLNEMEEMDDDKEKRAEEGEGKTRTSFVRVAYARKRLSSAPKNLSKGRSEIDTPDLHYSLNDTFGFPLVWTNVKTSEKHVLWRDIDYLCRWVFPMTFCLCLCIYWIILFIHSRLNSPDHKPPSYCD